MLKEPVDKRCRDAGLQQCEEITEGVLLYVEEKPADGKEHLRVAVAANSPANRQNFASAITAIGDLPGTAQYMGPVLEAARFLNVPTSGGTGAMQASYTPAEGETASTRGRTAGQLSTDEPAPLEGMATPLQNPAAFRCGAGGVTALCVRAASGPIVITGLFEVGQCNDRALGMAGDPSGDLGSPRWAVSLSPSAPTLTGVRLSVRQGEAFFVALQSPPSRKTSPQCAVMWSGFGVPTAASPAVDDQALLRVDNLDQSKAPVASRPVLDVAASEAVSSAKRVETTAEKKQAAALSPEAPTVAAPPAAEWPMKPPPGEEVKTIAPASSMSPTADQTPAEMPGTTARATLARANALVKAGKYDAAIVLYEQLVGFNEIVTLPDALRGLGIASYYKGDKAFAVEVFKRYLPFAPAEERGRVEWFIHNGEAQVH